MPQTTLTLEQLREAVPDELLARERDRVTELTPQQKQYVMKKALRKRAKELGLLEDVQNRVAEGNN